MKIYRLSYILCGPSFGENEGSNIEWHRTKASAENALRVLRDANGEGMISGTIQPCTLHPGRAGLVQFLQRHTPHLSNG